jgi:hypothetical protein
MKSEVMKILTELKDKADQLLQKRKGELDWPHGQPSLSHIHT